MDQALEQLAQRLQALEQQVSRLEAREQIQDVMGRFAFLQSTFQYREILDRLFSRRKDRSYEDGTSGVYTDDRFSPDLIFSFFRNRYGLPPNEGPADGLRGRLVVNALTSPVVEVAEDGRSAHGVWITCGHETAVYPAGTVSGFPSVDNSPPDRDGARHTAQWVWQKYSVHFILEDGAWRILHMHVYEIFRCPFGEDWVDYAKKRAQDDELLDAMIRFGSRPTHATFPTTRHWQYAPDALPPDFPEIPG